MKTIQEEIWRDIPDYEGYYQASDEGRVRSLSRTVLTKNGVERFYKGRIFEGSLNNSGYKRLRLSKDGKSEHFLIHQLITMTFLNHTPDGNTLVVDHIDGDKLNNRIENLRIVTHRDNNSVCFRSDRNSLSSNFAGVTYHKQTNKWRADIAFHNKNIYLGLFDNEEDASNAYQKALAKINDGTFKIENYEPKFSSKYKGITFHKASQKWLCQPYINGKQVYLGIHTTEEEAFQMILLYESIQPIVNNC